MYNYTLKYKTFDQLLSEVMVDFKNYTLENMIEPQELIKVARRINYDLGLRICRTNEAILEVEKGSVRLPYDFYTFNYAFICGSFTETIIPSQGAHIEEKLIPKYREQPANISLCTDGVVCPSCKVKSCGCTDPCSSCRSCSCTPIALSCDGLKFDPLQPYGDSCVKPRLFTNCKNECVELIQVVNTQVRTYQRLLPLRLIENAEGIECGCPGLYMRSPNEAWIKDGFLYTNLDCAKVYINYEAMMQDENGNLLVPDHEMLNEYYEYGLKERILENLMLNDEDVVRKLEYVSLRRRNARIEARTIVDMPNFAEIKRTFEKNRKAQYNKYYSMFASYPWFNCSYR